MFATSLSSRGDDRVALGSVDRLAVGHRSVRRIAVFGVGDVVPPRGRALGDGDVGHEVLVAGAVPVLLTVRREVDVAGPELDDLLAA